MKPPCGTVYLVGAGPGDPGLLTLHGAEYLSRAEVVVYDYLVNPALLEHAPEQAERIQVGKHGMGRMMSQEEINLLLIHRAQNGKTVVRLKGGDPFVFGRGAEEAEALEEAGVPWEVVPGITAALAATAYAGIPLTHRDLAATVVLATGHERWEKEYSGIDWNSLARQSATVVLYMSVRRLQANIERLIASGRSPETPAALIEWGSLPRQRVIKGALKALPNLASSVSLEPPALLVVGPVVSLREELAWFERKPLFGKRVLITRARGQAGEVVRQVRELGGDAVELPTIEIVPPETHGPLDEALVRLGSYDWVVFTSQNAVSSVFERLAAAKRDARAFGRVRVCAIGQETAAALRKRGVIADLVPEQADTEGLVRAFVAEEVEGRRFLLPRAVEARETFPEALRLRGAQVDIVAAYRTLKMRAERVQDALEQVRRAPIDVALFGSASQVAGFFELLGPTAGRMLRGVTVGAIGPVTARALAEHGISVQIIPRQHTMSALIESLLSAHPGAKSKLEE